MIKLEDGTTIYEAVQKIIKDELKNNLKVNTSIQFPSAFCNGYILTEVKYNDEVIYINKNNISKGSTMFSF